MSFEGVLREILDGCEGTLGVALMGSDGIPIEQVGPAGPVGASAGVDVAAAGVEFGRILDETRKASDALAGGALLETLVQLANFSVLLRVVDDDTFLVIALSPDANPGKARYVARRHVPEIRALL
jgi:predicted regulator of Ras-like GTPase activity (Roadblock/LC7/MglB family)